MRKINAKLKAELLAIGTVNTDELLLTGTSTSAAGPGADKNHYSLHQVVIEYA
jgi:hypothetical protein